jgi:peptide deformylase
MEPNDEMNDIRIYGDPVLRERAAEVEDFDDDLLAFAARLAETMYDNFGLGLAAPQVGVSSRVIALDLTLGEGDDNALVMVNPEILESEGECTMSEGCLSVPGIYEELTRPERVRVRYRDVHGVEREIVADGVLGRAAQHEIDHLNGVLFVDRLSSVKRQLLAKSLHELAEEGSVA